MSDLFGILQKRYQALASRQESGKAAEFLEEARTFIADARQAGAGITDLNERSQLRAWMRFLATTLYDATGVYPDVTLQPLARGQLVRPQAERKGGPSPALPVAWMLVGGAAAVIIAVGLFLIGWLSRPPEAAEETPTPRPAPFVSYAAVEMAADTFCLGTPAIGAELALERIEPEMEWRWELKRDGDVVAAQPAAPWGAEAQRVTIRALTGGLEGVEPGHYDLLVYVDDQVVGVRSFRVLDLAPRGFDLRVADVPGRSGGTAGEPRFEPGARVIYLAYEFEGFCPGLEVTHTLYREGEPVQERVESWSGESQGQVQASFAAPGDQPFPAGEYEVVLAVAGEEQARAGLAIGTVTPEPMSPALGEVTIALGVQPDGTPVLTAPDNRFDWNTKVVYAIFDYVGMSDGLRWAAVWTRGGQEVARQESFWDADVDRTEGTRWVTYQGERGQVLPGGNYSVTLSIEGAVQRSADFNILYYVPPQ